MSGVRSLLDSPKRYELLQRLVGGTRSRRELVRDYVQPEPGARVLDLGCGPGELVPQLGNVNYVGVDLSPAYIEQAKTAFPNQEFRVGDATRLDEDLRNFDLVLAFGVLHHLDDEDAERFLRGAAAALAKDGRFVSVDPALLKDDRRSARLVISYDRGEYVRAPEEYEILARRSFADVEPSLRSDLLRIPYTHCILVCG
jgi:SAM-dependent methyltransferase